MYSLDLTTKNDLNNGFRKRHKDITEKDLMQAFKNCLNSLRKKAKAKKGKIEKINGSILFMLLHQIYILVREAKNVKAVGIYTYLFLVVLAL